MEPHNFLEEEIYNVCCIITIVASNVMCHLGESINNNQNSILPSRGSWEGYEEIHANIIPRP